jgi:hypothetical protein
MRGAEDLLDGWFLDDGMLYHPAPFERLADSLRAGNPDPPHPN